MQTRTTVKICTYHCECNGDTMHSVTSHHELINSYRVSLAACTLSYLMTCCQLITMPSNLLFTHSKWHQMFQRDLRDYEAKFGLNSSPNLVSISLIKIFLYVLHRFLKSLRPLVLFTFWLNTSPNIVAICTIKYFL